MNNPISDESDKQKINNLMIEKIPMLDLNLGYHSVCSTSRSRLGRLRKV